MNREAKKQWLKRYRQLVFESDSLKRRAQEWYIKITSPPCKPLSHMPRNPSGDKTGDTLYVRYMELEQDAADTAEQARIAHNEIRECINSLSNLKQIQVLTYRYLEGKDWAEIIHIMNYSPQSIYNIHKKALDAIEIE